MFFSSFARFKGRTAAALGLSLCAAIALPATADAGSATANLGVQVLISSVCTISTTAINFGTYDGSNVNLTAALTATGGVTATCTTGSIPVIGLGVGTNGVTQQRYLKQGANLLKYSLYQPPTAVPGVACNYTAPALWGDGTAATTGTTFAAGVALFDTARSYNVCGSIPGGQDLPSSTTAYTDTVLATVNF